MNYVRLSNCVIKPSFALDTENMFTLLKIIRIFTALYVLLIAIVKRFINTSDVLLNCTQIIIHIELISCYLKSYTYHALSRWQIKIHVTYKLHFVKHDHWNSLAYYLKSILRHFLRMASTLKKPVHHLNSAIRYDLRKTTHKLIKILLHVRDSVKM